MEQVAAGIILVAATIGALAAISKKGPVPWLWHRLVAQPLREWVGNVVDEQLDKRPLTNGQGEQVMRRIIREELNRMPDG